VNEKKLRAVLVVLLVLALMQTAFGKSAELSLRQGNKLYTQGNFNEAINKYDQALIEKPQALEPKFNKANSYYRLDDLTKALDLYREVAADSKDMKLVTKAKYNLANSYFQQGSKQKDSDLQKALEDLQTSISYWRQVLDIEPENEKAARNIEVARLIIKDIIDQLNKQKQQQRDSRQDPNQPQQQQQDKQEQPRPQSGDPNQQEQQQQQTTSQQDPNEQQEQQSQQQREQPQQEQITTPDTTAQEILDKEQRQRKMRQMLQRPRWQKVEKDW
jgi:Ca-activated chloride channel family protein